MSRRSRRCCKTYAKIAACCSQSRITVLDGPHVQVYNMLRALLAMVWIRMQTLHPAEDSALTVAPTSLSKASTCRSSLGCCRTCAHMHAIQGQSQWPTVMATPLLGSLHACMH